ncbi:MAG TPA: hypothetical protein VE866_13700 [Candidatus Binatia bacterium]|jgi:hypothetical protein|nr:hypothetical protein [Candidatus Binatia bacterium]
MVSGAQSSSSQTRRKRHLWRWIFLALLFGAIAWVTFSANPFAQGLRELGGDKPDQSILERSFLLAPRGFRYYTFSLPGGSSHVALVGEFTATPEGNKFSEGSEGSADSVELLVLSEAAFAAWQTGSTTAIYDSGWVSHDNVRAELPTGAGIYYVVFSNKFPAAGAINVRASLRLHVSSWLPEWMRRSSKHAVALVFFVFLRVFRG